MGPMKKVLAAGVSGMLALSVFAFLVTNTSPVTTTIAPATTSPPPDRGQASNPTGSANFEAFLGRARGCFPDDRTTSDEIVAQQPCLEDVMVAAAADLEPQEVFTIATRLVEQRPELWTYCHNSGHSSGKVMVQRFWNFEQSAPEQREALGKVFRHANGACMNGFVHGMYDGIAIGKPTESTFEVVSEVCAANSEIPECGDGFGHAAYQSSMDLTVAVGRCRYFEERDERFACGSGVIMRRFELLDDTEPRYNGNPEAQGFDAGWWSSTMVDLCRDWPVIPELPESTLMCWRGIVYELLKPTWNVLSFNNMEYDKVRNDVHRYARMAQETCDRLGKQGAAQCMEVLSGQVIGILVSSPGKVEDHLTDFCSALEDGWRSYCTTRTLENLAKERERGSEIGRAS